MYRRHFADAHLNLVLLRLEFPWQAGRDVGIETNGDGAAENVIGRPFGDLGGAAEAGGAAEPVVERHRRVGRADHPGDQRAATGGDHDVAPQRLLFAMGLVRSLRFAHIGRTRTPGPFTSVMA